MNYFVTVTDHQTTQWQTELLLESFKVHNLQDKLHVALIPTEQPNIGKNLSNHKNLERYANIGKLRGFEKLNKLYAILHALTTGKLTQPFIAFEPEMVLFHPIQFESYAGPQIIFQSSHFLTQEFAQKTVPNLANYLPQQQWLPIGKIVYFNNIPIEYFHQVIRYTEFMAFEQLRENKEIYSETERIAWASNVMSMINAACIIGTGNLEQTMSDNTHHTFINYEDGLLPFFSKKMFSYSISFGNPFEILSNLPIQYATTSTEFLAFLARRLL